MSDEMIYGFHAALEALENNVSSKAVYLSKSMLKKRAQQVKEAALQAKVKVVLVDNQKLDQLSSNGNHQGVAVEIKSYQYLPLDELVSRSKKRKEPFLLILDEIEDPHNLGSILRTADAASVDGIIIPKRRAVQLTQVVAKVSTGAIEHVPVTRVTNINSTIDLLKKEGFWIFGTDVKGADYSQWDASGAVALVIGNEGRGISAQTKKKVDQMLTIPMAGHVQSLNASVAAALLVYQAYNSRRLRK